MKSNSQSDAHRTEMTRRRFMKFGLAGAGLLLASRLVPRALAGTTPSTPAWTSSGKAKSIIQIWLSGGPSHIDMFDPKPNAGRDYCGPYGKPIATNVNGIEIGQMFPQLAKIADRYAILRGMTHGNNGHETAAYMVQAGHKPGGTLVYPGIGAVVAYFKGQHGVYKGTLPPYITVTRPQGRVSECGFLGSKYRPFSTGGDPNHDPFAVEGIVAENVSTERQHDRKAELEALDSFGKENKNDDLVEELDANRKLAYNMILGDASKIFTLSEEKTETRDRYGRTTFGQSCLLARRLVAQGVPFVTINNGGWDTHKQHFESMNSKLPELDKAVSALLLDLEANGLLDSTIVWVSGEFGRTPKILWEEPWEGGRGHYGKAFSALVAGGGFRGGKVVGKTDEHGENVVERRIYPWDLLGSMYALMGIDSQSKIPVPEGGTVFVSPLAANEVPASETGGILKEIM
jgi:hypothetical protein